MNRLVRTIVFYTFGPLDSAHTSYMSLFPAVFTLQYARVYVCTTNCDNKTTYVEPPCYELKPLELGKRTNSCIKVNTRELDRVPSTK